MKEELDHIIYELQGATALLAVLSDQFAEDSRAQLPNPDNYAAHCAVEQMLRDIKAHLTELSAQI